MRIGKVDAFHLRSECVQHHLLMWLDRSDPYCILCFMLNALPPVKSIFKKASLHCFVKLESVVQHFLSSYSNFACLL